MKASGRVTPWLPPSCPPAQGLPARDPQLHPTLRQARSGPGLAGPFAASFRPARYFLIPFRFLC